MAGLREYTWSNRVLQWLPLAGTIGLGPPLAGRRRARRPAGSAAFVLAEGASPNRPVRRRQASSLAFVPALPAFALLVAAIPLLVPGFPGDSARAPQPPDRVSPPSRSSSSATRWARTMLWSVSWESTVE